MYYLLFLQQFIASSSHLSAKFATNELSGASIILLRGCFAVALYGIWHLINRKKVIKFEKKDLLTLIALGALNLPVNQYLFMVGVHYSTAPNAALAYALTPAFVLVLSALFLKEKLNKGKIAGVLIAISGSALVLAERGINFSSQMFVGNLMVLAASFSWALYTLLGRNFSRKYGPIYATSLTMYMGLVLFFPIQLIFDAPIVLSSISYGAWFQIIWLGVIISGVGYSIWYYALSKYEAGKVAVFNNLQPILTTIMSIFAFGHQLSWQFVLGGIIAIIGVIITQRS